MRSRGILHDLLPPETSQLYGLLLLLSGAALLVSTPIAGRLSQSPAAAGGQLPLIFLLTYAVLMALVGLHRGSAAAAMSGEAYPRVILALQVAVAQLLMAPFLVFVRAVLPSHEPRIALIAAYVGLVSFAAGMVAFRLERWAERTRRDAFPLKHVVVFAYYLAPFFLGFAGHASATLLGLISPIGAVYGLLEGMPAHLAAIAFLAPVAIFLPLVIYRRPLPQGRAHE